MPQIRSLKETPLFWIDSEESLEKSLDRMEDELKSCPLLAVDLEYFNAIKTEDQCAILSLIQISTDKSDYIFDCFMTRDYLRRNEKF